MSFFLFFRRATTLYIELSPVLALVISLDRRASSPDASAAAVAAALGNVKISYTRSYISLLKLCMYFTHTTFSHLHLYERRRVHHININSLSIMNFLVWNNSGFYFTFFFFFHLLDNIIIFVPTRVGLYSFFFFFFLHAIFILSYVWEMKHRWV